MPLTHDSSYPGAPWYQTNGHWQTFLPAFSGPKVAYRRERLELPDGDFLDLDWLQHHQPADSLVVLTHGLEGNSRRPYMRSMARYFHQHGWDALAWNCRSCSGEMNRLFRFYHHGETEDIHTVIEHALHTFGYRRVVLIGFSMGGAMTTKYLSVHGTDAHPAILGGIAFSAPFDLKASVDALDLPQNRIFRDMFMKQLARKMHYQSARFPGKLDMDKLKLVKTWRDFDEHLTAPFLGLPDAAAFYTVGSARLYLPTLQRPVLAVSALNDPIIIPACLPLAEAPAHPWLHLELPATGGHIGFSLGKRTHNWMDVRAWAQVMDWCGEKA